jgi:hypothetical protein
MALLGANRYMNLQIGILRRMVAEYSRFQGTLRLTGRQRAIFASFIPVILLKFVC